MNIKNSLVISALACASVATAFAEAPSYPGGTEAMNEYIRKTIVYPTRAEQNGIEGIVMIAIEVDAAGNLSSAKISNSIDPDLEQEALRVVKTIKGWIPPVVNGSPAPSSTVINVVFNLP